MAYCRNCGADAEDGTQFCPYCGQTMRNPTRTGRSPNAGNRSADPNAATRGAGHNTSGRPRPAARDDWYYREDGFDVRDVSDNRYLAVLCYFNVLLVIPLLLRPNSAYIRCHCNQGLLLTIFTMLVSAASRLPLVGWIAGAVGTVFGLVCFVRGILNAVSGSTSQLPVIGVFSIIN